MSIRSLAALNVGFLEQGAALIGRLPEALYRCATPRPGREGVGPHFRHCLDFYRCFLHGLDSGRIDYDHRERDARTESEREHGLARIHEVSSALSSLPERNQPLEVRIGPPEAAGPAVAWGDSSVARELGFLESHTVHHFALIALQLRSRGFEPGPTFGVAPSTLELWKQQAQPA